MITWAVYDEFSNPLPGLPVGPGGVEFVTYRDELLVDRPQPTILDLGGGLYGFVPPAADVVDGVGFLVRNGTAYPSYWAGAVTNPQNPLSVWGLYDLSGNLWTGAAPTITTYVGPGSAPAVQALTTWLYLVRPSRALLSTGDMAFIASSPAAADPGFYSESFELGLSVPAVSYPADAVAQLLQGTIVIPVPPGGANVLLTYGAGGNLHVGPMRPEVGAVPTLEVSVLQSGGFAPQPYMGQPESFHVSSVQVTVRSPVDQHQYGEGLARALHARMHENTPPAYTWCLARESEPVYLGTTDAGSHIFVFNLDLAHRR